MPQCSLETHLLALLGDEGLDRQVEVAFLLSDLLGDACLVGLAHVGQRFLVALEEVVLPDPVLDLLPVIQIEMPAVMKFPVTGFIWMDFG